MEDGAIIVQNISEGWVCQLNKDGTEIVKFNDGSRYEKKPDGSTLERDSNNTVTQTLEDGIIIRVFEDGKKEQCTKCPSRSTSKKGSTTRENCTCDDGLFKEDTTGECLSCPVNSILDDSTKIGIMVDICSCRENYYRPISSTTS